MTFSEYRIDSIRNFIKHIYESRIIGGPTPFDSNLQIYLEKTHIEEKHTGANNVEYHVLNFSSEINNNVISEIIIGNNNNYEGDIRKILKRNNIDCNICNSAV